MVMIRNQIFITENQICIYLTNFILCYFGHIIIKQNTHVIATLHVLQSWIEIKILWEYRSEYAFFYQNMYFSVRIYISLLEYIFLSKLRVFLHWIKKFISSFKLRSIFPSIDLFTCPSISLYFYLFIYLSIHLSIHRFIYLSIYLLSFYPLFLNSPRLFLFHLTENVSSSSAWGAEYASDVSWLFRTEKISTIGNVATPFWRNIWWDRWRIRCFHSTIYTIGFEKKRS